MRMASWLPLVMAVASALAALLMALPMPVWPLWLVHGVLLETSLATVALALLAAALAVTALARHRSDRRAWTALILAVPAAAVALPPFVAPLRQLWRHGHGFSLVEYAFGAPPAPVRVERDVELEPNAVGLAADVYHATGTGPHPFVVVVHGGGWRGGDKGQGQRMSRALASAGITAVDVRYSLSPAVRFPRAVTEVKCLLGRLRERAATLGLAPSRAALLGRSAGGQIALIAAYSSGDPRMAPSCPVADDTVRAVVSLYAPTELAWGYHRPLRPDVVRGPDALRKYLGGSPEQEPEAYRLASPLTWSDRTLPPALLIHGTGDRLVSYEHSVRLASGLDAAGKPVRLMLVPRAEHAFDIRSGGVGEQAARAAILRFLAEAL